MSNAASLLASLLSGGDSTPAKDDPNIKAIQQQMAEAYKTGDIKRLQSLQAIAPKYGVDPSIYTAGAEDALAQAANTRKQAEFLSDIVTNAFVTPETPSPAQPAFPGEKPTPSTIPAPSSTKTLKPYAQKLSVTGGSLNAEGKSSYTLGDTRSKTDVLINDLYASGQLSEEQADQYSNTTKMLELYKITNAVASQELKTDEDGTVKNVITWADPRIPPTVVPVEGIKAALTSGEAWQLPDGSIKYFSQKEGTQVPKGAFKVGAGESLSNFFTTGSAASAEGLTGEAFLSTLKPELIPQVKAIAEGRMQIPGGMALRSPYWQSMLSAVSQYDPNFDAINYNARYNTRKEFTSGKDAANITALNTAIAHLSSLKSAYDALDNGNLPLWNLLANAAGKNFGNKDIQEATSKVETFGEGVSNELARVFRQVGMSETEVNAWRDQAKKTSASPTQYKASIEAAVELMFGRLNALGAKYSQGMGVASDGIDLLSPEARATLQKLTPNYFQNKNTTVGAVQEIAPEGKKARLPDGTIKISDGKGGWR